MAIEYTLVCDECGHIIDANSKGRAEVRRVAKREGSAVRREGRDLCAKCANAETERAPAWPGRCPWKVAR